jgi:hypothetical protein
LVFGVASLIVGTIAWAWAVVGVGLSLLGVGSRRATRT